MWAAGTVTWAVFFMASSLFLLMFLLIGGRKRRLDTRLEGLNEKEGPAPEPDSVAAFARSALPKMGSPLIPKNEEDRTRLHTRLIHAGLYNRQAMVIYLGVKMLLIVVPPLLGLAAGLSGLVPIEIAVVVGAGLGVVGMIGPGLWLNRRKANRQSAFRRALPDALDVLVICLEGGLSLPGGLRRVAGELGSAHPLLAAELNIAQREVQLGRSPGEALRQFADRADLEELRSLASVISQAERFGASLVKALRVHAESLRGKRLLHAEEMAQKAATKVLFPTILCILPGVFIVILGPAVIQIVQIFGTLHR
jgi:tight adherence protein C